MHNQITSTLLKKRIAIFSFGLFLSLITHFFFRYPHTIKAQETVSDLPPTAFYNNELIITYKNGYSPSELSEKISIRKERADSVSGSLQNVRENISLMIAGEERPEDAQENIESVLSEHKLKPVPIEEPRDNQVIYTVTSESSMNDVIRDASNLEVEYVQPNYTYYLLETPDDTFFPHQWGFQAIHVDKAWEKQKGNTQVKVAIIDSGIDKTHPDLIGHVEKSKPIMAGCYNDGDSNGHGTHVAGVIGAISNNATGIAGINWNITLMGYCAFASDGKGSSAAVAQGIRDAVDDGAKIINMSLGGPAMPNQDLELLNALEYAASKDVVIVAAAGNCGRYTPGDYPNNSQCRWGGNADKYLPASSPHAISVAGTGPQNERASYSNYGSTVDVAAPGGNPASGSSSCTPNGENCILSTWNRTSSCPTAGIESGYCSIAGTSMAAPHVTGLAALIRAAKPSLNRAEVQAILQNTARDLGQTGRDDQFGYGLIDAQKALDSVATDIPSPSPSISVQPSTPPSSCENQKIAGDYNCDGSIALSDFESWRQDFENGNAVLSAFENFRKGFTKN